jgi:V/A-type H+-transporting ATPase subunit I
MAVLPVKKVHIVVYKGIKDRFLENLQKEGIVHIIELEETTPKTSESLIRINDALSQLSAYKKRSPLSMFFPIKRPMNFDAFSRSADTYNYERTVEALEELKSTHEKTLARAKHLQDAITVLTPWKPFADDLASLRSLKQTDALLVVLPSKEIIDDLPLHLENIPHSLAHVNTVGAAEYCILFVKKEHSIQLRNKLIEQECEIVDFRDYSGVPADLITSFGKELAETQQETEDLARQEKQLSNELMQLENMSDHLANQQHKEQIAQALPETVRTINIIGWVLKRHLKRLDHLVEKAQYAFYETIEPEPTEIPPVALQNVSLSKPYEMLVKLYSMPHPREYDPTPFLAVFFPIMFGLCITDAVYGILLILISLFLMKKVTGDKSLFNILLVGGIFTIFAGAMVGGWMGDIFDYIGFQPLIQLKNTLMLFDPVKDPMVFIAIALGLGFVHMMIGIAIEIIDNCKNGEYGQAIFANLTWFIIIPSILLYAVVFRSSLIGKAILELVLWTCIVGIILASHPEGKPKAVDQLAWAPVIFFLWYGLSSFAFGFLNIHYVIEIPVYVYLVVIPLLVFEFARPKEMKKVLGKIAWGFYNLYGISNFLGVLLSYVRLMALGMVTGVIAIAINKIAWMITGIPVLGIILVILILIPSHLFNLVINVLGGFIHTMRLQYIEFFGRFYSGGSKPFKPFRLETNYVEIE